MTYIFEIDEEDGFHKLRNEVLSSWFLVLSGGARVSLASLFASIRRLASFFGVTWSFCGGNCFPGSPFVRCASFALVNTSGRSGFLVVESAVQSGMNGGGEEQDREDGQQENGSEVVIFCRLRTKVHQTRPTDPIHRAYDEAPIQPIVPWFLCEVANHP